jgi:hypothetical protein
MSPFCAVTEVGLVRGSNSSNKWSVSSAEAPRAVEFHDDPLPAGPNVGMHGRGDGEPTARGHLRELGI